MQLVGEQKYKVALPWFERALEYDPKLWRARGYAAYIASVGGDWTRAEAELERIQHEQPGECVDDRGPRPGASTPADRSPPPA